MKTTSAALLLILTIVMIGCEPQTRNVVPRVEPFLPDVPVPTAFMFDPQHSTDYAAQGAAERFNNYHYVGRAPFAEVVAFYKKYMPVEGWELSQDVGTGGQKRLSFRKTAIDQAQTTCMITIFVKDQDAVGIQIIRVEK